MIVFSSGEKIVGRVELERIEAEDGDLVKLCKFQVYSFVVTYLTGSSLYSIPFSGSGIKFLDRKSDHTMLPE